MEKTQAVAAGAARGGERRLPGLSEAGGGPGHFTGRGCGASPFPAGKGEAPQPLARSREGLGSRSFPLLGCASGNREHGGRWGECGARVAVAALS